MPSSTPPGVPPPRTPTWSTLLKLSKAIRRARRRRRRDLSDAPALSGVTDREIGELVGHLAVNVLTNYFNVLTRVENDWPAVTPRAQAA